MKYDTIILELLSRIKSLEDDVTQLKQQLNALSASQKDVNHAPVTQSTPTSSSPSYQKMTEEMMMICYKCGKKLHAGENLTDLVDCIEDETGMNRNSAIMYLYAVSAMLGGTIYKRAINATATKMYFDQIFSEYGSKGLKLALEATRLHIDYRKDCGHTVDSIEALYNQYAKRL